MMSKVEVSIIIPVYNVAPFLDECLSSCINQTFRDIEIIVVNDGSTDESGQIIEAYAAKDRRFVVVNKKNEGLIYARKSGLDIARGVYVYHLDGDDYIETNTIEKLYDEAIKSNSDYIISYYYEVYNGKKEEKKQFKTGGLSGQDFVYYMIVEEKWAIWGRLIRKSLFDKVVYRFIFMGEDLYFNMQIGLNVKKIGVVDACLYNHNKHSGSVTGLQGSKRMWLDLKMYEGIFFLLKIYHYRQSIIDEVYRRYLLFYRIWMGRRNNDAISAIMNCMKEAGTDIFDWKKRGLFNFMYRIYLYSPFAATCFARLWLKLIDWNRKYIRN